MKGSQKEIQNVPVLTIKKPFYKDITNIFKVGKDKLREKVY